MTRERERTWETPGITDPVREHWAPRPGPGRRFSTSRVIGDGPQCWERASEDLLAWAVKTRSGFALSPGTAPPVPGQELTIIAHLGPLRVHEPAEVVTVLRGAERAALSYTTRRGHPVRGEEAFILHRAPGGEVVLTLRSVTAPAPGWRAILFPVAMLLQRVYRARYLRALR
jgi:uncharacterized protein (UPF0548 family)